MTDSSYEGAYQPVIKFTKVATVVASELPKVGMALLVVLTVQNIISSR